MCVDKSTNDIESCAQAFEGVRGIYSQFGLTSQDLCGLFTITDREQQREKFHSLASDVSDVAARLCVSLDTGITGEEIASGAIERKKE